MIYIWDGSVRLTGRVFYDSIHCFYVNSLGELNVNAVSNAACILITRFSFDCYMNRIITFLFHETAPNVKLII